MKVVGGRRLIASLGALAVCVAAGAAAAWACTREARIVVVPISGPPGSIAEVRGEQFSDAPVTIRWNSRTGEVLASAAPDADGKFTVDVVVPDAAPDVYNVVAETTVGPTTYTPAATFTVTAATADGGGSPGPSKIEVGSGRGGETSTSVGHGTGGGTAPEVAAEEATAPGPAPAAASRDDVTGRPGSGPDRARTTAARSGEASATSDLGRAFSGGGPSIVESGDARLRSDDRAGARIAAGMALLVVGAAVAAIAGAGAAVRKRRAPASGI